MGTVVCFGEVLLRFSAPGREQLLQSPRFDVCVGGAEANVAVSLARLGTPSEMVSVLPEGALGDAALGELRRHGVGTAHVRRAAGRMGLYFLAVGALLRPSEVLYDRAGSVFETAPIDLIDWVLVLEGADRLHLSGVTPALGADSARAALRAAEAANAAGVPVSFDGNYRAKLWERWGGDSAAILRDLMACADILFADDRDIGLVLGRGFGGGKADQVEAAADAAFAHFPRLRAVACTARTQHSVDRHDLAAHFITRGARLRTRSYELASVVDRVGAGDAFVAGVLHALHGGETDEDAVAFGLAAAALKHSIPGDFNLVSEADVAALMAEAGFHVRR